MPHPLRHHVEANRPKDHDLASRPVGHGNCPSRGPGTNNQTLGGLIVKKIVGIALAVVMAVPLVASGAEVMGKVKSVEANENIFVLEDGTRLWADKNQVKELQEGMTVRATYTKTGDKNLVTDMDRKVKGDGPFETTNFGTRQ